MMPYAGFDFLQHKTTSPYSCRVRTERRQAGGYEVSVDEIGTACLVWQKLLCKGGLASPIWTGYDYNFQLIFHC